jgi:tight adherence protein B
VSAGALPWALPFAGLAGVLGLVAVVDRLYARDRETKRIRVRAEAIAAAYGQRVEAQPEPVYTKRRRESSAPWVQRWTVRVLRVQTGRRDLYPVPWWTLLAAVLLIAFIGAAFAARLIGLWGWLTFPVEAGLLARMVFGFFWRRRQARLFEQMPDALSAIVRAVRAGLPVTEALRTVGQDAAAPTAGEFARLAGDLAIGLSLQDSLVVMAARTELQEYNFFAVALALQGQTGGNLAETLENLADVVRKRVAVRARGYALAAEARTTAGVLVALPFIAGGVLAFVAPTYLMVLFTTDQGRKMLFAAAVLLGCGVAAMRTMIRRSLS